MNQYKRMASPAAEPMLVMRSYTQFFFRMVDEAWDEDPSISEGCTTTTWS